MYHPTWFDVDDIYYSYHNYIMCVLQFYYDFVFFCIKLIGKIYIGLDCKYNTSIVLFWSGWKNHFWSTHFAYAFLYKNLFPFVEEQRIVLTDVDFMNIVVVLCFRFWKWVLWEEISINFTWVFVGENYNMNECSDYVKFIVWI